MRSRSKKILNVTVALVVLSFVILFIFSSLNNNNRKYNLESYRAPLTSTSTELLDTSEDSSTVPTEDEDVFRQRQLRAESNGYFPIAD